MAKFWCRLSKYRLIWSLCLCWSSAKIFHFAAHHISFLALVHQDLLNINLLLCLSAHALWMWLVLLFIAKSLSEVYPAFSPLLLILSFYLFISAFGSPVPHYSIKHISPAFASSLMQIAFNWKNLENLYIAEYSNLRCLNLVFSVIFSCYF